MEKKPTKPTSATMLSELIALTAGGTHTTSLNAVLHLNLYEGLVAEVPLMKLDRKSLEDEIEAARDAVGPVTFKLPKVMSAESLFTPGHVAALEKSPMLRRLEGIKS